jgi:hypothetical protein
VIEAVPQLGRKLINKAIDDRRIGKALYGIAIADMTASKVDYEEVSLEVRQDFGHDAILISAPH